MVQALACSPGNQRRPLGGSSRRPDDEKGCARPPFPEIHWTTVPPLNSGAGLNDVPLPTVPAPRRRGPWIIVGFTILLLVLLQVPGIWTAISPG